VANFAVVNADNVVQNVILAESLNDAKEHTQSECIEVTEETRFPSIGWEFYEGVFRSPQPSSDYTWDSEFKSWMPTVTE
jgi:hypothetical protein